MLQRLSIMHSVLAAICVFTLLSTCLVEAKNVAGIEQYQDEKGRLRRRFTREELPLQARDGKRLPFDLDRVIDEDSKLLKRDPKRLPLDVDRIINEENRIVKRGKVSNQQDFKVNKGEYEMRPVSLDSKLTSLKETLIFFGYARNDIELAAKLSDETQDIIIIAPTNDAISALPMKPWEYPQDIENLESSGATAMEIDNAIQHNILKFVRSHVVAYDDNTSYREFKSGYTTLRSVDFENSRRQDADGDILLKKEGDTFYVASNRDKKFHEVEKIETASNGVVLVVGSCLEWP